MSAAFAPHDWIIAQAAPFDDDDWPYQTYANIVDYTMLMAYDQTDDSGAAGRHRRPGLVREHPRQADEAAAGGFHHHRDRLLWL